MSNKVLLAVVATAALSFTATARAQAPAAGADPRPPWIVACEADMKKHCDAEMKAKGDVRPCLAKHEDDLSQSCKDVFLRKYKILELCKSDIETVCGGTQDGRELGKCFNEKQAQLSDKCKSALRKGSKEQKAEAKAEAAAVKAEAGAAKAEAGAAKADKAAKKAEKAAAKAEKAAK